MEIKKIRILRTRLEDMIYDDFNIDQGCCFFHDRKELTQFTDIDDDIVDGALE